MKATRIIYRYCRAGNKRGRQTAVAVPGEYTTRNLCDIERYCTRGPGGGFLFVPEIVGLPSVAPWQEDWRKLSVHKDSIFHEFMRLEHYQTENPDMNHSIQKIAERFQAVAREGWPQNHILESYSVERRQKIFREAIQEDRMEFATKLLSHSPVGSMSVSEGHKLFQYHYALQHRSSSLHVLKHLPGLANQLNKSEKLWLLQAEDTSLRQKALRLLGKAEEQRQAQRLTGGGP